MRGAFFDGTNVQMRDVELQAPKARRESATQICTSCAASGNCRCR